MNQSVESFSVWNFFFLITILFIFITLKVLFIAYSPPLPDEAYYWLWSKRIDLSYYDHPPLSMWLQYLFSIFTSSNKVLVRIIPTLSLSLVMLLSYFWLIRLNFYRNIEDYLITLLLLISVPLFNIFFSISFPDPVLILTLLTSGFFFYLYSNKKKLIDKTKYTCWYLSVFFFSLGLLAKYNAVLFGIGILTYLTLSKRERENIIYSKHFFISIIIVFIVFFPVIYWNAKNSYASFGFNLDKRLNTEFQWQNILENLITFSFSLIISLSPILFWNLLKLFRKIKCNQQVSIDLKVGKHVLFVSILFCIILSFFTQPLYYWAIPGFVLLIPYLSLIIDKRSHRIIHCIYGLVISTILFFNTSIYPVSMFFEKVDRETAILYGWDFILENVEEEKKRYGLERVLFSDYRLGSLYAFHAEDTSIDVLMGNRETQFDIWRDENQKLDSLIFVDDDFPLNTKIEATYSEIKFLKRIDIKINSKHIKTYKLYMGVNKF